MRTWPEHNPDYRIARFDDATARAFLAERLPPEVLRAYAQVREPAQQADIFRLAWLATEGGVYADADDRCLAPLGTILPAGAALVLFQEELGTLANDFIAARPGHPALLAALDLAVGAINRGDSDIVWLSTGPGLLTRAFVQWLPDGEPAVPDGAIVLDRHELFQAVAPGCMTGYKTTRRHWSNSAFAGRPPAPVAGTPAVAAESHVGEPFRLAAKPPA
jgi:mannosyltransferase OCH1-like enzyme